MIRCPTRPLVLSTMALAAAPASAQDDAIAAALALLEGGRLDEAESVFQAEAAGPDAGRAIAGLAAVAGAEGRWDAALALARDAIARDQDVPLAYVVACRGLVATGDLAASGAICLEAIARAPDDANAYRALCASYVARYRWADAAEVCAEGAARAPSDDALLWRLGVARAELGRTSDAIDACNAAIAAAPGASMAHYCLGAAHLSSQAFELALDACAAAVEGRPENALAWYCRGMARLGLGDAAGALDDCRHATELAPAEGLGHFCVGRALESAGVPDAAADAFRRAVTANDALIQARGALGALETTRGRYEEGERWLRDALLREPTAARHSALGQNLFAQGRYAEARATYEAALARAPDDLTVMLNVAACHRFLGDRAPMYALIDRAVALDPSPRAVLRAIDTAVALRDLDRMAEYADQAAEVFPTDPEVAIAVCSARVRADDPEAAVAACDRASTLSPERPTPHTLRAAALIALGRAADAEGAARAAIALGGDDAPAWFNLGNALAGQGRLDEAESALRASVTRDPSLATAHFVLGNVLSARGQDREAAAAWCRAAELEPAAARFEASCSSERAVPGSLPAAPQAPPRLP